jgi:hypothetical protein
LPADERNNRDCMMRNTFCWVVVMVMNMREQQIILLNELLIAIDFNKKQIFLMTLIIRDISR